MNLNLKNGGKSKSELALDYAHTAALMIEVSLVCARKGLWDLSKWFKEDARKWLALSND